jgi:DNA-binding NarL/FixJ family response regulator
MVDHTRVVIADDHGLLRRGTREILEQDERIEVVGEAADGVEAVRVVVDTRPDVVLMDIGMPTMNGIVATKAIKTQYPSVNVIVLTIHDDDEYVWQAIRAGASGYLLKDIEDEQLIAAVHAVVAGGAVLDPAATAIVMGRVRDTKARLAPDPSLDAITSREQQVLQLAAAGHSNRHIASALDVSPRTVEAHLHHVYQKLGVQSRTEAVVVGVRRGLVCLTPEP